MNPRLRKVKRVKRRTLISGWGTKKGVGGSWKGNGEKYFSSFFIYLFFLFSFPRYSSYTCYNAKNDFENLISIFYFIKSPVVCFVPE